MIKLWIIDLLYIICIKTIQNYACMLEYMDAIFIQHALLEDKLTLAPKKPKKLYFSDPFIYHAIANWIEPSNVQFLPIREQLKPLLIETIVVNHIRRFYPTYYIKAEGEVDVAYIKGKKFYPIEIKWTNQLRSKDLKQIQKYHNALIVAKQYQENTTHGIKTIPIPQFLYDLEKCL